MSDDTWVEEAKRSIVVFCEAKKGPQDLNPSWASPERKVMESFLALVGAVSPKLQPAVAKDLYAAGRSELADGFLITTLLINHDPCGRVIRRWPNAPRVTLSDALDFVYGRFRSYEMIKTDHSQWRPSGHRLWDRFEQHRYSRDDFVERLLQEIGVV